jgi:hypothetical protein
MTRLFTAGFTAGLATVICSPGDAQSATLANRDESGGELAAAIAYQKPYLLELLPQRHRLWGLFTPPMPVNWHYIGIIFVA